jgi:DNA polymerase III epsilon subunit-like protein
MASIIADLLDEMIESITPHALVFDTETSDFNGSVLQLGYATFNTYGVEIENSCRLLKLPDGEKINPRALAVHKITHEMLDEHGEEASVVLQDFSAVVDMHRANGGCLVAHNASFDCARLLHTCRAWGLSIEMPAADDVFCTMQADHGTMRFVTKNGKRKNPGNAELYERFFGEPPSEELHDALNDARVTARNYFRGKEVGLW